MKLRRCCINTPRNHFAANINAQILKETADAMVSNGLKDAGFTFFNLDDGWAINRTADGVLVADPKLFPPSAEGKNDGIKIVADYIHQRGLQFGIYTARGSTTCLGRPGSDSHEQLDADTWASWGVDYLKEDSCGGKTHGTVWEQYAKMRDALNKTGRPIYYSITEAVPFDDGPLRMKMHCYGTNTFTVKPWLAEGRDPTTLANSFLVEYCNNLDFFGYT
jgi:alpha-galactosidase